LAMGISALRMGTCAPDLRVRLGRRRRTGVLCVCVCCVSAVPADVRVSAMDSLRCNAHRGRMRPFARGLRHATWV
jgi:hypothetical protein